MNKTLLLIKNYFSCFLGNLGRRKSEKAKYGGGVLILLIMGGIFLYLFINLAIGSVEQALKTNYPIVALYVTSSMGLVFILLMTITKSTTPTKHRDDELLLSLPVSKSNIIVAKTFYNYLFDLAIVGMTLLPSYIVYYIYVPNVSIMLIIRGLVLVILLPMFSNALGYFISLLFTLLTRKLKHFRIIQSFITMIAMLVFLAAYYGITVISTTNNMLGSKLILEFKPLQWMVNYVDKCELTSILIILLITVVPFILSIIVKSALLGKTFGSYKNKSHEIKYTVSTPLKSLYHLEISRYFNLPIYVINTLFGGVLLLIMTTSITILAKAGIKVTDLLVSAGVKNIDKYYILIIVVLFEFTIITICTTSASISLEGKNLWILKAHPVSEKSIFLSKILLNLTVSFFPIVISSIIISFNIGFIYLPLILGISLVSSFIVAQVGLLCNLYYPKLEWESEATPIKQSMSVALAFGFNAMALVIPFIAYFFLEPYIGSIFSLLTIMIIYIIEAIIIWIFLNKKGTNLFKRLYN